MTRPAQGVTRGLWQKYRLGCDRLKTVKRQVLRFPTAPDVALKYAAYRRAVARRDWPRARERALALAARAIECRDRRILQEMMHALERFECFEEAARAHRAWRDTLGNGPANPWRGEDLTGKTLVVDLTEKYEQGLGVALRGGNFAAKAMARAARVIIVVEPRLVPLFARSLPGAEVRESAAGIEGVDFTATRGDLSDVFVPQKGLPDPDFRPLAADPGRTSALRARYQGGREKPLIGLFWRSSHFGKELPALDDWARLIAETDGTFVSLQYGDIGDDLAVLGPERVIVDPGIDQLTDMDAFAAQVAALDAVIGISGTPIHLAGALGVPTIVLRDDWFRRQWPVMTDRVPWYPSLRVVGKDGRDWREVMDEARETVLGLVTAGRK